MRFNVVMGRVVAGAIAYFIVVPGSIAALVPWLLTGWHVHSSWPALQILSAAMIFVGLTPLVSAFVEFVKAGGTPSPNAAPRRLVIEGFNRYARNPMYIGVLVIVLGQALLFTSIGVAVYAVSFWAFVATFVRWYEEPTLSHRFGAAYQAYRQAVPAWHPRLHPWTPEP